MRRPALVWIVALLVMLGWSGSEQAPWGPALATLGHASPAVAHPPAPVPLAFEPTSVSQVFDPVTDALAVLVGILAPLALRLRRQPRNPLIDPAGPAPRLLHARGFSHALLLDGG